MLLRIVLASCSILVAGAIATAQEDPIRAHKDLMKIQGRYGYVVLPRMVRGQDPYDQAKIDQAFTDLTDTTEKLPRLWPESAKPTGPSSDEYSASPKIWENKADFEARLTKFANDVADYRGKVTDLDSLKVAFTVIRQNCDSCHELYRVKN